MVIITNYKCMHIGRAKVTAETLQCDETVASDKGFETALEKYYTHETAQGKMERGGDRVTEGGRRKRRAMEREWKRNGERERGIEK